MSDTPVPEYDPALLDLHLGALPPDAAENLRRRVESDETLTAQDRELTAVFAALDTVRHNPQPEAGLTNRIARRVANAGPPLRTLGRTLETMEAQQGPRVIRMHNFRDIVAVAAMIILAIGIGVPSILHMRDRNARTLCAANLRQVGQGLQSYAAANAGALPFVGWNADANWQVTGPEQNNGQPNRRHIYLLLRNGYVPATAFICPSSDCVPMECGQKDNRSDFLCSSNISYAYQNMAGVRPRIDEVFELPVLSDDNPFFESGRPLFDIANKLGLKDPAHTNSLAHGQAGQNVLFTSGRAKWFNNPNVGVGGDNIWTLRGVDVTNYTGREGPKSQSDAHLLK